MHSPRAKIFNVDGCSFLLVTQVRPSCEFPWFWRLTSLDDDSIGSGYAKTPEGARKAVRRKARSYILENPGVHMRRRFVCDLILRPRDIQAIEAEVKGLLHAHRDTLRNRGVDTTKTQFNVGEGYYGEAFGVMRALEVLGYGTFKAVNRPARRQNLSWWFHRLCAQVLKEEHYGGSGVCKYCRERYGKDDSGQQTNRKTKMGSEKAGDS